MNVNFEKVTEVTIKDANGKVQMRFQLGSATLNTMHDKSKTLELSVAPERRPISKWGHKNGDTVIAINHRWDTQVKGVVTKMEEGKFYLEPVGEDQKNSSPFWCFNANVQQVVK